MTERPDLRDDGDAEIAEAEFIALLDAELHAQFGDLYPIDTDTSSAK